MGRKKLSDSAKKKSANARQKRFRAAQLNIGDQHKRWTELITRLSLNHRDLAKLLIDRYLETSTEKTTGGVFSSPRKVTMVASSTPGLKLPQHATIGTGTSDISSVELISESNASLYGFEVLPDEPTKETEVKLFNHGDVIVEIEEADCDASLDPDDVSCMQRSYPAMSYGKLTYFINR